MSTLSIKPNGQKRAMQWQTELSVSHFRRQFREPYTSQGYPSEVKEHCLKLYLNISAVNDMLI